MSSQHCSAADLGAVPGKLVGILFSSSRQTAEVGGGGIPTLRICEHSNSHGVLRMPEAASIKDKLGDDAPILAITWKRSRGIQ